MQDLTPASPPQRFPPSEVTGEIKALRAGNDDVSSFLCCNARPDPFSARVSPIIARRKDELPKAITDIAWAAQLRLHAKFTRLLARKVMKTKAVVAVARELAGFVWAIGQHVQTTRWPGLSSQPASD